MVIVTHVSKTYGAGHTAVHAVNDVSLKVHPGEIVLIMGPSGSGKTTLLSMIGTLLSPTKGNIIINDQNVAKLSSSVLPRFRLHEIGFVFQSFNLLAALTAVQNVALPMIAAGMKKKRAFGEAKKLLERFGLQDRGQHLPADLSGGEKQRVAVARALINDPQLVLADEPTANLDSKTGHAVTQLLCEIACQENRSVVIVSHDQRLQDVAKRIYTIEDGHLVSEKNGGHDAICTMH